MDIYKKKELRLGISINPYTDEKNIIEILPYISNLLFMTVIPGKGGQKLIQEVLPKIKNISGIVEREGYGLQISVDRRGKQYNSKIFGKCRNR